MATLEVSVEQILALIQQLPLDIKQTILDVLQQDMHNASLAQTVLDAVSSASIRYTSVISVVCA